jgi:molybdenum cofactor cytidylyltransferase
MMIAGIILAAGTSSRMGCNKLLLDFKGRTVIEETISQMEKSEVDEVLVITGHDKEQIERLVFRVPGNRIKAVYNNKYRSGRAESIKCALGALDGRVEGALFMVGDKPGVGSELINKAIAMFKKTRPSILYVKTPAGRGHPIIFARAIFEELLAMEGDMVGNDIIASHKDDVIELEDPKIQVDIDTEKDYIKLINDESGE